MIAGETEVPVGTVTGEFPAEQTSQAPREPSTGKFAFLVGAGILLSRIVGVIRQRVFAHYFGTSAAADAFNAAFRIPNFLQNIFGEGALSASFIPVYAGLLARENKEEADRVASAILTMLALVTSLLVLVGVLTTPYLIDAIAPGFKGETRELTIRLVKILFPGAGLLVLSAWCLGVLNSHRRFFLSTPHPSSGTLRSSARSSGSAVAAAVSQRATWKRFSSGWRNGSRGGQSSVAPCSLEFNCQRCFGSSSDCVR